MSDAFSDPNTMGELRAEIARLRTALSKQNDEICQTLGRALGYPKFCDDQQTFPGATESSGVCTGDHVAESIAVEAAKRIESLRAAVDAAWREGWMAGRDAARVVANREAAHASVALTVDLNAEATISAKAWRGTARVIESAIAALAPPENADE
jgi:hypothetical protein